MLTEEEIINAARRLLKKLKERVAVPVVMAAMSTGFQQGPATTMMMQKDLNSLLLPGTLIYDCNSAELKKWVEKFLTYFRDGHDMSPGMAVAYINYFVDSNSQLFQQSCQQRSLSRITSWS